jgi:hypothetical protein
VSGPLRLVTWRTGQNACDEEPVVVALDDLP